MRRYILIVIILFLVCLMFLAVASIYDRYFLDIGAPFTDKDLTITFPTLSDNPDKFTHPKDIKSANYKINSSTLLGMSYQEVLGKWYAYSVTGEDDQKTTPYDLYDLKIINYSDDKDNIKNLASVGLSDDFSFVKSGLVVKYLLAAEDFKIKNFVVMKIKTVNKNALNGYYFKIKLNLESNDQYIVDAVVYMNSSRKQLYVLAVYYESNRINNKKNIIRFFNSFKVFNSSSR